MESANKGQNSLQSEVGDRGRSDRTSVSSAYVRMVNPGGNQPGPINSTGNQENIRYEIRHERNFIQKLRFLFSKILILISIFLMN